MQNAEQSVYYTYIYIFFFYCRIVNIFVTYIIIILHFQYIPAGVYKNILIYNGIYIKTGKNDIIFLY